MGKHIRLIVGLAVLLSCPIASSDIGVWGVRGQVWAMLSDIEKNMYVAGVMDGLIFAKGNVQGVEISYDTSSQRLRSAIDQFYADYRNELIPVPFALKVISLELAGTPETIVDKELESLRQQFVRTKP